MSELTIRYRHLPHWELKGSVYAVTFRTKAYRFTYPDLDIIRSLLLSGHQIEYLLYVACIMPDHVHAIVQPIEIPRGNWKSISQIMKRWKGASAIRINKLHHRSGRIWQTDSYDHIIRNQQDFDETWNYIVMNPVKAGIVSQIEEYPFTIIPERESLR